MIKNEKIALSLLSCAAIFLASCQVQPLYGSGQGISTSLPEAGSIKSQLAAIEIASPETRTDQLVRNELQFSLSGGPRPNENPLYTLDLEAIKSVRSVGISDVDFGPAAFFVTVSADYVLKDPKQAAPIAQGTQEATASYDRVDQEFSNIRSERDAEIRAAKTAAQKIRQALALALQKRSQQ